MPTFVPLDRSRPLPTPGTVVERPVMDWKVVYDTTAFHKAKDVAAFANHLGGTILVGAVEKNGQLERYVGMSIAASRKLRCDCSSAVAQRCQPTPAIDCVEYEDPGDEQKRIVAVNVQPSLSLVGVKLSGDDGKDGYGGEAWTFPVRSGTDSIFLQPGQLAMFMTPRLRRTVVMLSRLIPKERVIVVTHTNTAVSFVSMTEEANQLTVERLDGTPYVIPLDMIRSVHRNISNNWVVKMHSEYE